MSVAVTPPQDTIERFGTDVLASFPRPRRDLRSGANSRRGSRELVPSPGVGAADTVLYSDTSCRTASIMHGWMKYPAG